MCWKACRKTCVALRKVAERLMAVSDPFSSSLPEKANSEQPKHYNHCQLNWVMLIILLECNVRESCILAFIWIPTKCSGTAWGNVTNIFMLTWLQNSLEFDCASLGRPIEAQSGTRLGSLVAADPQSPAVIKGFSSTWMRGSARVCQENIAFYTIKVIHLNSQGF